MDQEVWQHYWQVEIPTQRWLLVLAALVIVPVVEREASPTHWRRLASRRLDSDVAVGDPCCTVMCQTWMSLVQSHLLDWSWLRARYFFPPVIAARGTGLGQSPEMHLCGWWAGQEQQDGAQRNLRDLQRDCSDPRQHRRSLSGEDLGRMWGRLAAAWPGITLRQHLEEKLKYRVVCAFIFDFNFCLSLIVFLSYFFILFNLVHLLFIVPGYIEHTCILICEPILVATNSCLNTL